jgi:hypothetical protein
VNAESFARTYQHLQDCRYVKTAPVWAEVAAHRGNLRTKEGESSYESGDYLVYNNEDRSDGYVIDKATFEHTYRFVEEVTHMTVDEYLNDRVQGQIDWYDKKSVWNQKRYKQLQLCAVLMGSAIPLLTVVSFKEYEMVIRLLIATLGSVIAVVSAVMSLYQFQDKWVKYRATAEALTREKVWFLTQSPPYGAHADANFKLLVMRCEGAMADEHSDWMNTVLPKEVAGTPSGGTKNPTPADGSG